MSAKTAAPPEPMGEPTANDPAMEDILASIRSILHEDDMPAALAGAAIAELKAGPAPAEPRPPEPPPASPAAAPDGAEPLDLTKEMLVSASNTPAQVTPINSPPASGLLAPNAAAATAASVGELLRAVSADRGSAVGRPGVTLEDIVREEMRPVIKEWLDRHLPAMVERLVRAEIERVVSRAMA
ncbi:MAG TPA: DUF2497 domain-containing protein [Acetobacteraceae bacterium]|nr:DUF2497 domain-containing protein [Acetobacteraceae bacterium]